MKTPFLSGPSRTAGSGMAFGVASVTRYLCLAGQLCPYAFGYQPRTTEGSWRVSPSVDGVIDDLEIYISANTRLTATDFTLMVNGVSSGFTATVGAGVTGWVGASGGPVAVSAGDLLSVRMVTGTGGGSHTIDAIQSSFTADSGDTVAHYCLSGDYNFDTPVTTQRAGPLQGTVEGNGFGTSWGTTTSVAAYQAHIQQDATATHIAVDVAANSRTVGQEVELYVNGAASGLKITIPAATTGRFTATGAVDIVPGDALDIRTQIAAAGSGTIRLGDIMVALTFDGNFYDWGAGPRPSDSLQGYEGATWFVGPHQNHVSSAVAAFQRFKLYAGTLKNLWARVNRAGSAPGNWPVSEVRVNGAAAVALTVDGGVTGSETATNLVDDAAVSDGDSVYFAMRTTNFSQSISAWGFSLEGAAGNVEIEVPAGELLITGQAPVVTAPVLIELAAGELLIQGQAPGVIEGTATFVPAGELVLQGQAPLVSTETAALASEQGLLLLGALDPVARADQQAVMLLGEIVPDVAASQQAVLILGEGSPCITERCQIWTITRRDGVVFRYTSLDRDLVYGNEVYSSCRSLDPSASENASTLGSTGNIELTGIIDDDGISEADLYGGKFDDAYVTVDLVAWGSQAESPRRLAAGWTGTLSQGETAFEMEVLGPGSRLDQQALVQMVTPSCRWIFGSAECGVDIEALAIGGVVTVASSRGRFLAVLDAGAGSSQWENGTVRWTGGVNAGQSVEVKTVDFDSGEVTLWAAPAYLPEPGDAFDLLPGCDKAREGGCTVYANVINHGGFPDVPGADSLLETPDAQY